MKSLICYLGILSLAVPCSVGVTQEFPGQELVSQEFEVVPAAFEKDEGPVSEGTALGFFSNSVQVVFNEEIAIGSGLNPGDRITGLAFRVGSDFEAPVFAVADYRIALATSLNSAEKLRPDFTLNRGPDYVVARTGPLSYDGSEYEDGSSPNAFGEPFEFQRSFTYRGGDLLLEYTHSFFPQVNSAANAVENFSGVQSQFSAGFNTTIESFGGFGIGVAPIIKFTVSSSSVLLGDVNQDGILNLLDVAPFVNAISNGIPIPEADINQDGDVNLLDISPFIDLLAL